MGSVLVLQLCHQRRISLAIGRRNECAWNTVHLIGRPVQIIIPQELFDAIGFSWIFSTLDLRSGYHQLPLLVGDRVKTAFWGVDHDGKINYTIGNFFHLALRMRMLSFRE